MLMSILENFHFYNAFSMHKKQQNPVENQKKENEKEIVEAVEISAKVDNEKEKEEKKEESFPLQEEKTVINPSESHQINLVNPPSESHFSKENQENSKKSSKSSVDLI